jgi:hypothetical protein
VDHLILNEFCKNVDAYRISAFMYKDSDSNGGLLTMGPIWDFNLSFGKAWFSQDLYQTEGWQIDYRETHPSDRWQVPFYWEQISRDPAFGLKVEKRWLELRGDVLGRERLFQIIDLLVDTLAEARVRNFQRWPESAPDHSYEVEIQMMKNWIIDRLDWIDGHLGELTSAGSQRIPAAMADTPALEQNYPNPFNSTTTINFMLPQAEHVVLKVYAITGAEVRTLINDVKSAGITSASWDGRDDGGHMVASGTYIYQLSHPGERISKKMALLR